MDLRGIGTTRRRCPVWAIPPTGPEYRLKMSVSKDPTVESRSNFFMCFRRLFSREFCEIRTTRRQRPVWAIPPTGPQYRLKRSVSKDPIVGSCSKFYTCFRRLFYMEFCGLRTTRRRRSFAAFPPKGPVYQLKMFVSKDPTVGSLSILPCVSRGFSPLSCVESALPADGVRSGPFHRKNQSTGLKSRYLKIRPLGRAQTISRVSGGCSL